MKESNIKKKCYAFSLAEMMIVMLIISIVTAAMLPVITKRQSGANNGGHCLWTESSSNSADIYSREASNASVMIGATERFGSANEKLQINSGIAGAPQIALAEVGTLTGALFADRLNNLVFGDVTKDANSTNNNVVIGQNDALIGANYTSVLGDNVKAGKEGVSIGYGSSALGSWNTSVGFKALTSAGYSSDANTAIGHGALAANVSGNENTAVGEGALESNTAALNSAFGSDALQRNSSGTYNTALGTYAMSYNQDGNNNTAVGYSANNQTDIQSYSGSSVFGSSAFTRGNNSIAVGYNAQVTGDSKISIGANSVVNTSGKSLYVDSGAEGIALGNNAKSSDGGLSIGYLANSYFNQWSMLPPIAIGYKSSAGDGNSIAIGGSATASGIGGIAIGPLASATGNTSIAIGSNEYGQLSGNGSQPNTTAKGWANVAIGNFTNAGPSDNAVVVGPYSSATGYGSTAIGAYTSATADYSTAIGYNAQSSTAHQIVIGTTSDTVYIPGHLVVGKNTILGARSANDNVNYQVFLKGGNKGAYSSWVFLGTKDYSGGDDNFYKVGSVTAGNVTISGDNGTMPSDRRLKNVKGLNSDGLDKINELKVYNYNFKKDKKHMPHVGVIAQDLQKVFPNSVKKSRSGYLLIRWDEMFYAMVNAIKELDLKIVNLSSKINALNSRENSADKKIDEIYKSNKKLSEKYNNLNKQLYSVKKENLALKAQLRSKKIIK
jgi:prepilin-type N-terminal cleavage/methylation domain-containing protein